MRWFAARLSIAVYDINTELRMSPIDRIKAKALQARSVATDAIKAFEADLDGILAQQDILAQKREAAVTPHQEAIAGIKGELDGLKAAMDILSNDQPTETVVPTNWPYTRVPSE